MQALNSKKAENLTFTTIPLKVNAYCTSKKINTINDNNKTPITSRSTKDLFTANDDSIKSFIKSALD